ncbi:hypothetical protein [uncultured Pedobacter sp.]|uniref:hypothetical protein n=1 Tax=uncultured Pedobacter sp. TaxID=246139 RepID=UPI0025F654CD|nr:hypothetical protein [uncultured Pedobacter sp.]
MEPYVIAFGIALIFFMAKTLIDFYALISVIKKDKTVLSQPNDLEKNYEFIKGLH